MKKIFIIICSCNKDKSLNLRKSCRSTWLVDIPKNINYKFFVGDGYGGDEDDVVNLDVDDSYWGLPNKVRRIYEWLFENGIDFDYIFKCDDDTYVKTEKIHDLISDGHDFVGNVFLDDESKKFASGGAGYFLSKSLLEKILKEKIPKRGLEDVTFSKLALKNTKNYKSSDKLYYNREGLVDDDMVTAHWLTPGTMIRHHNKIKGNKEPTIKVDVTHPHWKRSLELYKDGSFESNKSLDSGKYKIVDNYLKIYWGSWTPEKFIKNGENSYIYVGKV
jgi:hypothetical protein